MRHERSIGSSGSWKRKCSVTKRSSVSLSMPFGFGAYVFEPELKGSIGEGSNHSNYSDRSSVRILGIERKPRKTTSSKWHATQNTRRGRRKEKQTALRQRGGLRSRTNSNSFKIQEFGKFQISTSFPNISATFRQNFI